MPWGILIPADEKAPLEFRLFSQLKDYQEAVNGLIEPIEIEALASTLLVHEEARTHRDPVNRRASLLVWLNVRGLYGEAILGDVILIGQADDEGETQDVPADVVTLLLKTELYKFEVQTTEGHRWYGNQRRFDNYFEACNSALSLYMRWTLARDVRVVSTPT